MVITTQLQVWEIFTFSFLPEYTNFDRHFSNILFARPRQTNYSLYRQLGELFRVGQSAK